ncbi:hypothetical protein FS837_001317 [Tulasnella sp. UAMH 9824]|nr:hypothetical protein FS837_001317 [Tulasnella sp. UAMH 9824]
MDAHRIHYRIGNGSGAANALDGLGELYRVHARYREAEKAFSDALGIHRHIGNDLGAGNALLGLANTYLAQSRTLEAEEAFGDALQIHYRIRNILGLANALDGLKRNAQSRDQDMKNACDEALPGKLHHTQNRYLETEEPASKALAIAGHNAHQQSQTAISQLFAELITLLVSKQSKGMETLFKEEAEYARTNNHAARAATWRKIGDIQAARSMYTEAKESYHFAQALYIQIDNFSGVATAQRELGILYIQQHRYEDAERCFTEAGETYAEYHDRNGEAKALDGLTFLHGLRSEISAAQDTCRKAREIYTSIGRPLSEICTYATGLLQVVDENLIR